MKYFKWLLPITLITILPIVSCSTSWTKWNKSSENKQHTHSFKKDHETPSENDWKIDLQNVNKALDFDKKEINLAFLKNHFELGQAINQMIGVKNEGKSQQDIDKYYKFKDWKKINQEYFTKIKKDFTFKLKWNNETSNISWQIGNLITNIIDSLNSDEDVERVINLEQDPNSIKDDKPTIEILSKYINQSNEVKAFMKNSVILKILSIDGIFPLKLAKLTNFPKNSFVYFSELINELSLFYNKIFTKQVFKSWVKNNQINLNTITKKRFWKGSEKDKMDYLKANFVINALKYDT